MIPKFRAWDIENREMIRVDEINFGMEIVGTYIGTDERGDPGFGYLNFKQVILMQSTGLKDKNGVEIFEGDIVHIKQDRVEDKYIPNNTNCEISYEDGAFTVKNKVNETEWPINAGLYYVTWKEFEVIGNIYENPELLEEENAKN